MLPTINRRPETPPHVAGYANVRASRLARSIDFYCRVLAFRLVEDRRRRDPPYVFLRSVDDLYLMVYARDRIGPSQGAHFSTIVDDTYGLRANLWDCGVPLAAASGEPRRRYADYSSRSLIVDDPDGNRIEVFERRA